jgi:CheY-like chemotaxis protein
VTKVLVVDDEPTQSRGLLRALLLRRPDYSVFTAGSGSEAIALLEDQHVDLVITDLQMAEMDGFEFLAWLLSNRPHVLAFAMTAYATDDTPERLRLLGAVECFNKPLDVDALTSRVSDGLAQRIRGQVYNVGLASFLQLIELEKKTCTLEVRSDEHQGRLFVRKGELLDAQTRCLSGEPAALEILAWTNVSITIDSSCAVAERIIDKPTYYVVMEAMRVRDESVRPRGRRSEPPVRLSRVSTSRPPTASDFSGLFISDRPPGAERLSRLGRQTLESLHVPVGTLALAVVDTSGALVVRDHPELPLADLVQGAQSMLRQERNTLGLGTGASHPIEELVVMTRSHGELLKPMVGEDSFAFLVFDTSATNLVMARLELEVFIVAYCAACSEQAPVPS